MGAFEMPKIVWFRRGDRRGRFLGVPLQSCMNEDVFKEQAQDLEIGVKGSPKECFLDTHPVSKATTFLNIGAWPWLSQHGNNDVTLIASHFAPVLGPLPQLMSQCVALKMRTRIAFENGSLPSLPKEPTLLDALKQFHDT